MRQHRTVLSFRLFGIPVTVRGSFILVATLLGLLGPPGAEYVIAWVVLVFVSILIHELGHALTALAFGAEVDVELNGFGGLTRWTARQGGMGSGRRALVAAAGSAFGVAFGGAVWLVAGVFGPYTGLTSFVIDALVRVNVFWGLLNWLPIRPLDGGHLVMSLLEKVAPRRADTLARVIFVGVALIALAVAFQMGMIIIAVLAAWLLFSEFSAETPGSSKAIPPLSYDEPEDTPGPGDRGPG